MTDQDYSWITNEMYDAELQKLIEENASTLLSVPGVYEAVSEHFNNEALARLVARKENGKMEFVDMTHLTEPKGNVVPVDEIATHPMMGNIPAEQTDILIAFVRMGQFECIDDGESLHFVPIREDGED